MPVTSKQIAEMAGVSRGTVDRVLNDRPGVSKENRLKIKEIANRLGYIPNRAGKALSTAKKPVEIGIILNCVDNPFYDDVISGIEAGKKDYPDYNIKYRYCRLKGYFPDQQVHALDNLSDCNVIIITPVNAKAVAQKINQLSSKGTAVITLNSDIENCGRIVYVGCDYTASGRTAAGLAGLLTGGKGKFGIVIGNLHMLGHRQRAEGFCSVINAEYPEMEKSWLLETNDDDDNAYKMLKNKLQADRDISAIYFGVGGIPKGIKAVAEVCGDNMPVIIACDDIPQIRSYIQSGAVKATICQEPFRQGNEAVRQAMEYILTGRRSDDDIVYMKNEIKIIHNL